MYLRQFQYLIAVVDEGHFGRAATRCNATQPSLSNGVKQLELELGVPIFLRGRGQRLHGLTAEGHKIAKWARLIVSHCESMKDEVAAMQGNLQGILRIGAMPSMSPVLPLILKMVRASFPNIQVDVQFIGYEAMKIALDNFSLDVAIFYTDEEEIPERRNVLPIYTEYLSLLVPDNPAFAGRTSITWAEAAQLPLALLRPSTHERRFLNNVFESTAGYRPNPKVESESILHLMFQVQFTELCTVIPSHFARLPGLHPGTKALELVDPIRSRQVGLFWAEADTIVPMARVMVSIIKTLNKTQDLKHLLEDPTTSIDPFTIIQPRQSLLPETTKIELEKEH